MRCIKIVLCRLKTFEFERREKLIRTLGNLIVLEQILGRMVRNSAEWRKLIDQGRS